MTVVVQVTRDVSGLSNPILTVIHQSGGPVVRVTATPKGNSSVRTAKRPGRYAEPGQADPPEWTRWTARIKSVPAASFGQEAGRACGTRGLDDAVPDVSTEHEHRETGVSLRQQPRCLQPGHGRHGHIHQNDVRSQLLDQVEGLTSIGCLTDDGHAIHGVEQFGHRRTNEKVVVGDQHAYGRFHG